MHTSQPTPQHLINPTNKQMADNTELTSHHISFGVQQINIQKQCRVCLQGEQINNPLISACQCLGFLQYQHKQCLQKWLQKLYQQSDNKAQYEQTHKAFCQICHTSYRIDFSLVSLWVGWDEFKKKIRMSKCTAFANVVFIVANLVSLIVGISFAVKQGSNQEFNIQSPKVFMLYFLILLTLCTTIYGIYQFANIFMLQKVVQIQVPIQSEKLQGVALKVHVGVDEEGVSK